MSAPEESGARYDIRTDVKYGPLVARLGILEGDFHWHRHEAEDELFVVLEGRLLIDLEGERTVTLEPHQGFVVPRGVVHRTRAPVRTAVLMVEPAGVVPTGDD
jgi:mannose-6-phosphate isomerase-like protein (cupin superfamily)